MTEDRKFGFRSNNRGDDLSKRMINRTGEGEKGTSDVCPHRRGKFEGAWLRDYPDPEESFVGLFPNTHRIRQWSGMPLCRSWVLHEPKSSRSNSKSIAKRLEFRPELPNEQALRLAMNGPNLRATMKYADLVQLYFDRSNAIQSYWTLYVVVIGGLLAFSSLRKDRHFLAAALVTVLYFCFAYKNLGAIGDATAQHFAILDAIKQIPIQSAGGPDAADADRVQIVRRLLEPTLTPPDYSGIRTFHVATDLLTVAALWTMVLSRRKPEPRPDIDATRPN